MHASACCPHHRSSEALRTALQCISDAWPASRRCVNASTSPQASVVYGQQCLRNNSTVRGLFVFSRAAGGEDVCTGGDEYHLWAIESTRDAVQFASLSLPVAGVPNGYWLDLSEVLLLSRANRYTFRLELTLLETQRRDLQHATGPIVWPETDDTARWLRESQCVHLRVPLQPSTVELSGPLSHALGRAPMASAEATSWSRTAAAELRIRPRAQLCHSVPPEAEMAYERLGMRGECGEWCAEPDPEPDQGPRASRGGLPQGTPQGPSTVRSLINTSNAGRLAGRVGKGFWHVLGSRRCQWKWYDEHSLSSCRAPPTSLLPLTNSQPLSIPHSARAASRRPALSPCTLLILNVGRTKEAYYTEGSLK
jgi:hypothetical protein